MTKMTKAANDAAILAWIVATASHLDATAVSVRVAANCPLRNSHLEADEDNYIIHI